MISDVYATLKAESSLKGRPQTGSQFKSLQPEVLSAQGNNGVLMAVCSQPNVVALIYYASSAHFPAASLPQATLMAQ